MSPSSPIADSHVIRHDAMNTTFSLRFRGVEAGTAAGMAAECIDRIDRMEFRLSRFAEGGDVSRINRLGSGETLYLSETCHQCLLQALDAYVRTGGLFDVTLGSRIEHRKSGAVGPAPDIAGKLIVHPDTPAVTCEEPGRVIDLGGIGKGYALDQLRQILIDLGAEDFLLAAGASSMLAYGPTAWPVELAGEAGSVAFELANRSLSASGVRIQGSHILHPGGDAAMPALPCDRVWVTAESAVLAEIWSTALMLLTPEEIPGFIEGEAGILSVHVERSGEVRAIVGPASGA